MDLNTKATAINQRITHILKQYTPYFVLFVFMLLYHLFTWPGGDDFVQAATWNDVSLTSLLSLTYTNWSARLPAYAALYLVVNHFRIWLVLDTLAYVIIAWQFISLLSLKHNRECEWVCVLLILMYPFNYMSSAGWIATSVNYNWVLAALLIALSPLRRALDNKKAKWYNFLVEILCLLYAGTVEQSLIILVCVYFVAGGFFAINKKHNMFLYICCLLLIACVLFVGLAPGNWNRSITEVTNQPNFNTLSFLDKAQLGISRILGHFIYSPNIVFAVFSLLLAILVHTQYQDYLLRTISWFPFACVLVFGLLNDLFGSIFPRFWLFQFDAYDYNGFIRVEAISNPIHVLPFFVLLLCCLCIVLALYIALRNQKKGQVITIIGIFILGIASSMAIAFTPTLIVTGLRTTLYSYFSFLFLSLYIYSHLKITNSRFLPKLRVALPMLATLSFIDNIASLPY